MVTFTPGTDRAPVELVDEENRPVPPGMPLARSLVTNPSTPRGRVAAPILAREPCHVGVSHRDGKVEDEDGGGWREQGDARPEERTVERSGCGEPKDDGRQSQDDARG